MVIDAAVERLGVLVLSAAVVTGVGVELMRRWGTRKLLDLPNERSSHTQPTPRGGGLPLIVVALVAWVWSVGLDGMLGFPANAALLASAVLVAVVSWIDDLRGGGLAFRVRLSVHLLAAAIVLLSAPPPSAVPLPGLGQVPLGFLAWPLALIWIAGLTNAYNFMDGIDGIAGGQGAVAGVAWFLLAFAMRSASVAAFGIFIAVGCAVFLLFNWSPARIFMGDVGSATLGFLFAAFPFVASATSMQATGSLWVTGSAVVWPFVFDSGFTLVRRWRRGEKITDAHRSHLYQRLVIAGWSHPQVTTLYVAWAATTSLAGWAMAQGVPSSGLIGLAWAAWSGIMVWRLVVAVEAKRPG
jgi:UDP-N-acetylmuramyl pentapeptide phosphotransferase/UDP-N-acetylglucosamine-1-phosphate transferase